MKTGYAILGIGAAVVCAGAVLVLMVAAPFLVHVHATSQAATGVIFDLMAEQVTVEAPPEAALGEVVELQVIVRNSSAIARELLRVEVADAYLDGFAVRRSRPPFRDRHVADDAALVHSYGLPVPPGEEVRVLFELYARRPGDFRGEVVVCIDIDAFCVPKPVRTIVRGD